MQTQDISARRFTPVCFALVAVGVVLTGVGTWVAFVPPTREPASVTVTGDHGALAACVSRVLRNLPGLAPPADHGGAEPEPMVSVLTHPGSDATRVMYEGPSQLSFVVTLTEKDRNRTEARIVTIPSLDPGPLVKEAVQGRAKKDSRTGAAPKP